MSNNIPVLELLNYRRSKYLIEHPEYLRAFRVNLTPMLLSELHNRMKYNLNFIVEIVGETGTGKSEAGFWFNYYLQKALGYKNLIRDNYGFSYGEAQDLAKKYNIKWTIQVDEQIRSNFGQGAKRELASLQDIEDTQRANQLNFIFISPTSRTFHTGVQYIIRTWIIDYKKEINYCLVFEPEDNKLRHPIGYIAVQRLATKKYRTFLKEYMGFKMEFNRSVQNKSTRVIYYEKKTQDAKEIYAIMLKSNVSFKTKKSILAYVTMYIPEYASRYTIGELSNVIEMVKILLDK